jgi:predicted acylesterase/phospholipase RssA
MDEDDSYYAARREQIVAFEWSYHVPAVLKLLSALPKGSFNWIRGRSSSWKWTDAIYEELAESVPPGLFSMDSYAAFYDDFLNRNGLARYFHEVTAKKLFITANDVDSSERIVFGLEPFEREEIGRCVAASSAIPLFFAPVRIRERDYFDGGIGRVAHADLLVKAGCDRIIVVNPVVPFRHEAFKAHKGVAMADSVADRGFFWVLNQAYRIMTKVKLHLGIEALVTQHPGLVLLLFEPNDDDPYMFHGSSMSFEARASVLTGSREAARLGLEAQADAMRSFLE